MKYLKKILITLLILASFNIVLFSTIFPVAIAAENEKENDIKKENNVAYNTQEDEDYEKYSEAYKRYLALSEEEKAKVYVIPDKYDLSIEDFEQVYGKKLKNYNTGLSPKFARATTIPTSFNLKDGNDFGVEDQGSEGLCWAFAALGSLRTHLALKNGENYDLSEWHMNYLTSKWYSKYEFNSIPYKRELGGGGNFIHALGYYKYNNGPVLEEDCPYQSITSTDQATFDRLDNLKPDIYVHQTIRFPTVFKVRQSDGTVKVYNGASSSSPEMTGEKVTEIRNIIKQHIMENGGITTYINASYRYKRYNIYNPDNMEDGHTITIIGWDDNYSKDNFKSKDSNGNYVTPTQNGAYLIMNSWGDDWGNNGFGWVSYEDSTIERYVYGYLSADTMPNYVTYTFSNTSSYNKMKEEIIKQFTRVQSEYSAKEQILIDNEVIKLTPSQNKIQVLDIVINEMTSLDMSNCNLTQTDFERIANASKAKYPKLKTLDFSSNHIYNVSNSILSKFKARKTLHFENQTFTVTSKADGTQTYRNIITQSKNSSSVFYSSSGLTFTGCTENLDGKGVTLTQDTATVKINNGIAQGTIMTIKRKNVTKPTVTITSNAGENDETTNSNNITYIFTWTEAVTGFTSDDIVIKNSEGTTATKGAWQEVSPGTRWILVVQNSGSCTQAVSVPADVCTSIETNASNDESEEFTINIDRTAPQVTITADKTNPTSADTVIYTLQWSEDVEDFNVNEDVTIVNGFKLAVAYNNNDGDGKYIIVVRNSGTCTQTVSVDANVCTDKVGNGNTAASKTIRIDRTGPMLNFINVVNPNSGTYTEGQEINIYVSFNEYVYGEKNAVKMTSTTAPKLKIKFGTGEEKEAEFDEVQFGLIKYKYIIAHGDNGKLETTSFTGKVYDSIGNETIVSNRTLGGNEIIADTTPLDTTPPTVTITTNPTEETTNASSITYTFTWSENVEGFTVEDVKVANGTKGASSRDGNTYTLVVTNSGSCTQTVKVEANKCTDTAGNGNVESETITRIIDRTAPELESIKVTSPASGTYRTGEDITIVATYNENIYINASKEAVGAETTVLKLKFGTGEERSATFSGAGEKTITYTYKIQTGDSGLLTIAGYTGTVYDAVGNAKELSKIDNTGNAITAMTYKKGDIDGNGPVNLMDLLKLRRHIANQKRTQKITEWELSEEEQERADVHENGEIDLIDILVLRRYIAASKSETVKQNHPGWYWDD